MRTYKVEPPAPQDIEQQISAAGKGWKQYRCELVTPMYGGGVEAGKVDVAMPIRASAIRGQLRFWWRLSCARNIGSRQMFERETAIWGGIGSKEPITSKVAIQVDCPPAKQADFLSSDEKKSRAITYAFGSASINGAAQWLKGGYTFQVGLRYPDEVAAEVETALRWWACFGGLGARTRRGFGSVRISDLQPLSIDEVRQCGARLTFAGAGSVKAEDAWEKAIGRLFDFRQGAGIGRKANKPRPGRSFWPEPDQLRRFTGRDGNGKHPPEHPAGNVFPRAAFGLPLTFEFRGTPGEPPKLELHPDGERDRMASPLILRAYWNGENWRPAALLLPNWEDALTQRLQFKGNTRHAPAAWPADPVRQKQLAQQIKPMQGHGDDPLTAFMHFFAEGRK